VSFSSTATCTAQPCTYVWAISCPSTALAAAQSVTLNGANVTVTVGPKGSSINTWQLGGPLVCNVTLTGRGAQFGANCLCAGRGGGRLCVVRWPLRMARFAALRV
jgi:hypothetical protein